MELSYILILTVSVVNPKVIFILPVTEVGAKVNLWLVWKIISSWESNVLCTLITIDSEGIMCAKWSGVFLIAFVIYITSNFRRIRYIPLC